MLSCLPFGRLVGRVSMPFLARPLVCALALLASGAALAQSTDVQQFTLANGLTLIVKADHRAPTASHMLWVRVGSIDEVDGTSGVAHALEHMLFKGTPSVKAGEFSSRVAALGGQENAFTTRDGTGYYQQIPASRLEDVMRLEADRFANNVWPDDEFKREIEVVKEERRMRTDESPRARLFEQAAATTFTASPYRRPIVGWMSDLDSMTPADARAFYRAWYVPANAAVVVAGDVQVAQVKQWAEKYYGRMAVGAVPARKPRTEPLQAGVRTVQLKAPASQAYVLLSFKVPKLEPADLLAAADAPASPTQASTRDALALSVLSGVLSGYNGARLERALVQGEDRVADSASASNGLQGRGPQVFIMDGVPAANKTPQQLIAALRAQIARVAQEGVSDAELRRVKTQWTASETYKLDSVFSQARELGSHWVQGLPLDATTRVINQLQGVTSAQVQDVAARYFGDDQLTVATLLPQPMPIKSSQRPEKNPPNAPNAASSVKGEAIQR